MSLTIGRAGTDDTATMFIDTDAVNLDGATLSMSGTLRASTEAEVLVLRQQLVGLVDSPDEPVVPILHTENPTIDGFYQVRSIRVDSPSHGTMQAQAALRWSGQFERVGGFGQPVIETIVQWPGLVNGLGVTGSEVATASTPAVWFPPGGTEISDAIAGVNARRTGADGQLEAVLGDAGVPTPTSATVRWSIPAADYYDASVALEVGTSFRKFVGRQLENSVLSSALDDWRIQNGLVRVSWDASDDTLVVQHHDSTQWETAKKYRITTDVGHASQLSVLCSVRVLFNAPERVTVRLALTFSSFGTAGTMNTVDLTVLRGEYMVRIICTSSGEEVWGIRRDTSEAAAALSSSAPFAAAAGVRASANDANGNRYIIATNVANTRDTTVGGVLVTLASQALFMVSTAIGGSGAQVYNTPDQQVLKFLTAPNPTQIVSVR